MALAIVHLSTPERAAENLRKYGLEGVELFHGADGVLYRAFGLERMRLLDFLSVRMAGRAISAICRGHLIRRRDSDVMQKNGAFLLNQGRIIKAHRPRLVSERLNFREFIQNAPATN